MITIFSVFYILIAAAMIVLILIQRGAGADAGSGFGGGASATVFGARGSSNFLTRTTWVLSGLFLLLSLGMGIYVSHGGAKKPGDDLGVMAGTAVPAAPAKSGAPAAGSEVPRATAPPAAAATSADGKPGPGEPAKKD
ncbi:MAG: preprotein translocase subunit SecG [Mizugakiibacter sp.]|uniref:preprotein translocase subunit SecG n=1 Tax=Mizugakiibacter sp. TaxID=1972610 RepID=UPI0031C406DF|nr:preprotein translocase subunit SecG [Xanthomonadaceae bacterium]